MNPLTNMKNVVRLSEQELRTTNKSWHDQYKDSAWIFVGGLPFDLSEGDIICVFSQYGEIVDLNLIRDKHSGNSKGYCFICYEDQRSTVLAVDNFNGIQILKRIIRVDHVSKYKVPKEKVDKKSKLHKTPKLERSHSLTPPPLAQSPAVRIKTENIKMELPPIDLRETISDQINDDIKLPSRLPIRSTTNEFKVPDKVDDDVISVISSKASRSSNSLVKVPKRWGDDCSQSTKSTSSTSTSKTKKHKIFK